MKRSHVKAMSTDELWALHQEVAALLAEKLILEKSVLESRLRQLNQQNDVVMESAKPKAKSGSAKTARRAYPTVLPKYRNQAEPYETWSGRGKQPRWLIAQLGSGKHIEDFRIVSERIESSRGVSDETGHRELRLASAR
jgi:DNA-binding protein H-NS